MQARVWLTRCLRQSTRRQTPVLTRAFSKKKIKRELFSYQPEDTLPPKEVATEIVNIATRHKEAGDVRPAPKTSDQLQREWLDQRLISNKTGMPLNQVAELYKQAG